MLKPTDSVPAASVTHCTHQVFVRASVLFCSASFVSRSNGPTIFPVAPLEPSFGFSVPAYGIQYSAQVVS